jgi:hypothetical protein
MSDIRSALARADERYARRAGYDEPLTGEHLDALAIAVRTLVEPGSSSEAQATIAQQHGEITALKLERDQLAEELKAAREDTQRRVDAATAAIQTAVGAMRQKAEQLQSELDTTRAATPEHHHTYEWPSPDQPPLPCACGHPYPRTVLAEHLAHGPRVMPDREPFDVLMGRIRAELSNWGSPATMKGAA